MIECWFDGVTEPVNPGGHGAWGAVVHVDGVPVYREGGYVGNGKHISNNCSEYSAFIAVLTEAQKYPGPIIVRGDSKLVIMQLQGKWKVNGGLYLPYYKEAKKLYDANRDRIKLI